ncbi:MAG: GC-type dockerin domain-anchored protein, partial [Planctomycetota bacterium]
VLEGGLGLRTVESMSSDLGPAAAGFDPARPGGFPLGELRIKPGSGHVLVVDDRENTAGASSEVVYTDRLVVEAGAVLQLEPGTKVYTRELVNNGVIEPVGAVVVVDAGCNAADIAAPAGVLNSSDISAFVTAFLASAGPADAAPPFGVINASDINAFVTAFVAGCP